MWKYAPHAIETTPLTPSPFHHRQYGQTFAQRPPFGNGKVSVTYRVTAILKQVNCAENITQLKILGSCPVTAIYSVTGKYCIFILACIAGGFKVTLGKWQGKCYIQGDRYFKASQLCRKYNATENFGKLSSYRNIQCDRQILYFYSSLHSWRLFVGTGRVKRAANPRN